MAERHKQFKKALALAEKTAAEWCPANGVTEGHLYQVFRCDREASAELLAKIDGFIAKYLTSQPTSALAS